MTDADRLLTVVRELKELQEREGQLVAERGILIKNLTSSIGWKPTALLLGVGVSRLCRMIDQARLKAPHNPQKDGRISPTSNGHAEVE